jgi:hypothetical protein
MAITFHRLLMSKKALRHDEMKFVLGAHRRRTYDLRPVGSRSPSVTPRSAGLE